MNIRVLKLVTGEELVADVAMNNGSYTVKNPLRIMMVPPKPGTEGISIGLAPFAPYVDWAKGANIAADKVVFIMDAAKDMASQYASIFSPLALPIQKSGLIVPR